MWRRRAASALLSRRPLSTPDRAPPLIRILAPSPSPLSSLSAFFLPIHSVGYASVVSGAAAVNSGLGPSSVSGGESDDGGLEVDSVPSITDGGFDNKQDFEKRFEKCAISCAEAVSSDTAGGSDLASSSSDSVGSNDVDERDNEEVRESVDPNEEAVNHILSLLQGSVDERLELRLDEIGVIPSDDIMTRILQSLSIPIKNSVLFFRWAAKTPNLIVSSSTINLFVKTICSSTVDRNEAFMLWDSVREIGERDSHLMCTQILNQLISNFAKLGKAKAVMEVFRKFDDFHCLPDGDSYHSAILALGKRTWSHTALALSEKMLASKSFPDGEKVGQIVKFLCKGGWANEALSVYLVARDNGKCPPDLFLGYLFVYLSKKEDTIHRALQLLDEIPPKSLQQAGNPFKSVMSGLSRFKDKENAKKLLDKMINSGLVPAKGLFNDVITVLSKAGDVEDAVTLLRVMEGRGLSPDIRAYNVIISGYARRGLMAEAHGIFSEAKKLHQNVGRISYDILLRGYCRINDTAKALNCMVEMKQNGLWPNLDQYRQMIRSLCYQSHDWTTAEKLLEEMQQSGLSLDVYTRSLVTEVKELEQQKKHSMSAGSSAQS